MKISIWLCAAAVAIVSVATVSVASIFDTILFPQSPKIGWPLITLFWRASYGWFFLIPIAWIAGAIWLTRRRILTAESVLTFAAATILIVGFLGAFSAVALAAALSAYTAFQR